MPVERIIERDVYKDRVVEVEVERVVEVVVEKVVFKDRDVEVTPPPVSLYISPLTSLVQLERPGTHL